ncbi:succinate dehydrogenase / fumarate reductase cytochrome b subunit [Breznakibacter xylanolyticus]|uniref:Succinate dehydrogenase / fumarate reductase cytochrome b subunit n=1 Tax=Breznakibacter xylanolyticus TaxID=990 RepID=A0A2W7NRI5_9BACT|nr:succinate dehydrogenase cytochrome b subunit [Breznakibacter xylanolyticus]MBN2743129.1 succinate dehydrogenase cytochrome b subunit [Marinilabiliaceae bacterium]PZX15876.1 succinate dehydrogenase / fumarate reductase cytochrome b subunit [Breznakibacter xylanolyticus]
MSNLFCSSVGKKLVMSISGLFLIMFLFVHLLLNSFLLIPDGGEMYNAGAHFMATNPMIKVMEPVLAIGFIVHIVYALILSHQNAKARGNVAYASGNKTQGVSWMSKNMLILGVTVLAFLVLHIAHFWVKMKVTGHDLLAHTTIKVGGVETEVENAYALVNYTFSQLWVVIVYAIAAIGLAYHLMHGFWSAFQTIGFSNNVWRVRLNIIGAIVAWVVGLGFAIIAVAQHLFFQA